MRDKAWQPVENAHNEELLEQDEDAPVQAPQDEVPGGAVPDTRKPPNNHHVKDEAWGRDAVTAKRDVHVVAKEAAE